LFSFRYFFFWRSTAWATGSTATSLIKLSFSAEGLLNTALIVTAVLFGVIVLAIHNLFEKNQTQRT
jgi:hypothetical protein